MMVWIPGGTVEHPWSAADGVWHGLGAEDGHRQTQQSGAGLQETRLPGLLVFSVAVSVIMWSDEWNVTYGTWPASCTVVTVGDTTMALSGAHTSAKAALCPILRPFAPCGLQSCRNGPAPFPGPMLYKATKPGPVLFYILACFNCIVAY